MQLTRGQKARRKRRIKRLHRGFYGNDHTYGPPCDQHGKVSSLQRLLRG